MKKEQLLKELDNLDLPEVEISGHRHRLKMALLDSGCWNKKTIMSKTKRFIPAGILAVVALVAVIADMNGSLSSVSAEELAKKSYQTVAELPADRQEELRRTFGDDVFDNLEGAGKAEDLKMFSFDEYVSEYDLPAEAAENLRNMEFLQYQEADGRKVVIGVDRDNSLVGFMATTDPTAE